MKVFPRHALFLALLAGATAVAACSSAPRADRGSARLDLLTQEEIRSVDAGNLYDVIRRLRPRWLEVRGGPRSFGLETSIVVYQNQALLGDVEVLRQLVPDVAYEIRWLDGPTASSTLPGLSSGRHVAGAIVISTRGR